MRLLVPLLRKKLNLMASPSNLLSIWVYRTSQKSCKQSCRKLRVRSRQSRSSTKKKSKPSKRKRIFFFSRGMLYRNR